MKELRVTIALRNNRLVRLREELGMNQRRFAEAIGLSVGTYGGYETMKLRPISPDGEWKESVQRIANFHGVSPEWLFPEVTMQATAHKATREIGVDEIEQLRSPERLMIASDTKHTLESMIDTLPNREAKILQMHYGLGGEVEHTLNQIGEDFGLSRERIRALEARGLRRIRDQFALQWGLPRSKFHEWLTPCQKEVEKEDAERIRERANIEVLTDFNDLPVEEL